MSPPRPRRAAIVGAGLMGRWHADAVRRVGGTVTVIVDPNESARRTLGARYPGARLLSKLEPEVVAREAAIAHVCSPVATHAPTIAALAGAGVHLLVEKPFTEDAASTRSALAAAAQHRVLACPVHQFVFQDGVRRVAEWLPSLGTVRRLEFSTCSAGARPDPDSQDALIAEILPHPLALVASLLRARVSEIEWQVAHPSSGEFRALASVGPTVVDVAISAHGRPTENVLRIVADGGTATADLFHGFAVRHAPTVGRAAKLTRPFVHSATQAGSAALNLVRRLGRGELAYPGLRALVDAFYAAAEVGGEPPIPPPAVMDVAIARDVLIASMKPLTSDVP